MQSITLKVGSAGTGRDQPNLAAAWAAIPTDLVAADAAYILELYNDSEFVLSSALSLTGKTTDATHTITIRPAPGQGYTSNPNINTNALRYNPANGVAIRGTIGYTAHINITQDYLTIEGIQQKVSGNGNVIGMALDAQHSVITSCLVEDTGSATSCAGMALTSGTIRNSLSILTGQTSSGFNVGSTNSALIRRIENCTAVRLSSLAAATKPAFNNNTVDITLVNCAGFGMPFNSGTSFIGSNNASDGTIAFGTNNKQNLVFANQFVDTVNDFRVKAGSDLIDGGTAPSSGNTLTINGARQQGTSADIGAWEFTSATQAPSATITAITVTGTTVTISGTTTGTPTSGLATISPAAATGNNAVLQGPTALALGSGTFTIQFTNVKVGRYSPTVTVSNTAFPNITATNNAGSFEIVGALATSVVQDPMDGQVLTIHGTTSGSPTSGSLTVPAAATNPNGAAQQVAAVALGTGTFTVTVTLAPGNYDAPILTFTTAAGTSLPQAGTSAVSVLGISGNPGAPPTGTSTDTTIPVMVGSLSQSAITQSGFTVTWQAATDDVAVTGYEVSTDGGSLYSAVGNVLTYTKTLASANTAYSVKVRAFDAAGNKAVPLSTTVTTLAAPGDTTAPVMTGAVSVTSPTQSTLTLSWTAATDNVAVTGYERSVDGGTNYSGVGLVTTTTLTGLSPSTTYPIRVRAFDAAGNRSNVVSGSGTTSAFVPGTATASVSLAVSMSAQYRANIAGLQWAWYDSAMMFGTPIDTGNVISVDSDGAILIQMPDSTKTVGQTGWMVITDLDEVNNVRYRVFSGAVVVR